MNIQAVRSVENNTMLMMKKELISVYLQILEAHSGGIDNLLLKSISNFLGSVLRIIWMKLEKPQDLMESIVNRFMTKDPLKCKLGLNIFHFILENLTLNPHIFGFLRYRRLCLDFQSKGLDWIYFSTRKVLRGFFALIQRNENFDVEIFSLTLDIMFKLLTFRFNISYYDFSANTGLEETGVVNFPDTWKETFLDLGFYENLMSLVTNERVNIELKIKDRDTLESHPS